MTKKKQPTAEDDMGEAFQDEIEVTDYGFIFDQEGQLKAVYWPSKDMAPIPSSMKKIFKLAGIPHPESFEIHTIH